MLYLYNTLSRKKEIFKPLKDKQVGLYTCGPTVYLYAHIGNLRTYIFEDILKRVLQYNGYKVKHVMNITDVGHLTSDADTGEDKLEKGAKREKKTVWQIADFYTKAFKNDIKKLNIKPPNVWIKATDTIKDQIKLIKILEKKGFTYQIEDGLYFDSSKLKTYGRLWGKKKKKLKPGARIEIVPGKKHPTDFALWKLTPKGTKRQMEWNSPWGKGFPGWHTECVVMSIKALGIPFDIHCGGIDHIPVHHTNEIAQAEAAFGKVFARYWLHGDFLVFREKMSKSKGNIIILNDLIKKGINPLAYRYLTLTAHYRSPLAFSWKSLRAAQNGLNKLYQKILDLNLKPAKIPSLHSDGILAEKNSKSNTINNTKSNTKSKKVKKHYQAKFLEFINNDLDMPKSLALTWKIVEDKTLSDIEKYSLLMEIDKVLGLVLDKVRQIKIPKKILQLVQQREKARKNKNWQTADKIRKQIQQMGYQIKDTKKGAKINLIQ